jgi:asparagine synthase (glutamine-hydrolysing)
MSAIIGIQGTTVTKAQLEQLLNPIRHRGPDRSVFRVLDGGGVAAGELQLSVRSTAALSGESEPLVLLDGEIYNPIPEGRSNVEYVREQYQQLGTKCFSRLEGSFACAVLDNRRTILARDAVGARPLIYTQQNGKLVFASEAKSMISVTDGVEELPPGHMYTTDGGLEPFDPYVPEVPRFSTPGEAAKILETLMIRAVRKRMQDGAAKGVSLSGGLDSSITAAVAKSIDPEIKLFSTTIERYPSPDLKYAQLMAQFLGLEHHIYEITDRDIQSFIPDAVWYMETFDEDCVSGAIANHFTSKMIKDHTNCVLVGEGADELFGGYFRELQDIPDPEEKERIARKLVQIAYNTALRRLDRGWLSNSVNYRTPFLDPEVVEFSNSIPMELKVRHDEHEARNVEKWILREALRDWLPQEIADRPKLRFAGGTGVDDLMDELTREEASADDLEADPVTIGGLKLNSPKELFYYNLFKQNYKPGYEGLVVRWDPFK